MKKKVSRLISGLLITSFANYAISETMIVNSKSTSSSVSSFSEGGYDRSSGQSAIAIDSRGQGSVASGNGGYAASRSSSFQGASSTSVKNDAAFGVKGAASFSSSQETSKVIGR